MHLSPSLTTHLNIERATEGERQEVTGADPGESVCLEDASASYPLATLGLQRATPQNALRPSA